jgi:hypothetical protein
MIRSAPFVENNTRIQEPIEKAFKLKELGKMVRGH